MSLSNVPTAEHTQIAEAAMRMRDWSTQKSLPFWYSNGFDRRGAFAEQISKTGAPHDVAQSRVRVQARQTYCFALGAQLGWNVDLCRTATEFGIEVLLKQCRRQDGLYGKVMEPGVGLVDDTPELYDNSFALLAFATAYRSFGLASAYQAGHELSNRIDAFLAKPSSLNGYSERLPAPTVREQNPHMHLCEASLAWFEATHDPASLKRADRAAAFIEQRFFARAANVLFETSQPPAENWLEVGHMFEWTWLLGRLSALNGRMPGPLFRRMYSGALALAEPGGFLPVSQKLNGQLIDARQRTWILTELIKAHVAFYQFAPSTVVAERICDGVERLFDEHLSPAAPGGWVDERSADGEALADTMTAATGYHVYLAAFELAQLAESLGANADRSVAA